MNIVKTIMKNEMEAINSFVECVEKIAETNMLKTGKLEGAHYAAMKQLQKEMNTEIQRRTE